MIKDITVCCEQGQIKVSWKWDSEEIEKVRITYKKKDSSDGDGIGFGEVSRIPHMEIGSQTRALRGEQGLYTFTFLPGRRDGSWGERVVADDVLLGERFDITWKRTETREGTVINFPAMGVSLPEGILMVEREGVKCRRWEEITSGTRLMFPGGIPSDKLMLYIKAPFDKIYRLRQK